MKIYVLLHAHSNFTHIFLGFVTKLEKLSSFELTLARTSSRLLDDFTIFMVYYSQRAMKCASWFEIQIYKGIF